MSRTLLCGINLSEGYSGGRYHAWMLAEALAAGGHDVTYWTNNRPAFLHDFEDFPEHDRIHIHLDPGFDCPPVGDYHQCFIVPDYCSPSAAYLKWLLVAVERGIPVLLLNFETPNFYNDSALSPRDVKDWRNWQLVSRYSDAIVSTTEIGNRYAREFYTSVAQQCQFLSCKPSINSLVADSVGRVPRERKILALMRFTDTDAVHKGGNFLQDLIGSEMSDSELVILVGKNGIPEEKRKSIEDAASKNHVRLRLLQGMSDREKFCEIKSSKVMLFLSLFEGFGYPPVEALYCNTPCIAFDLPVLREVSGNVLSNVPAGDLEACRIAINRHMEAEERTDLRQSVEETASFSAYTERASQLVEQISRIKTPVSAQRGKTGLKARQVRSSIGWVLAIARHRIRTKRRKYESQIDD